LPETQTPSDYAAAINKEIGYLSIGLPDKETPRMKRDVMELFDDLLSNVTGAVGQLNNLANDVDNFATAGAGQLNRLEQGVLQAKSAGATFKKAFTRSSIDADQRRRDARDDINSEVYFNEAFLAILNTNALLQQMASEIEIARRGSGLTQYVAVGGDTWEVISIKKYGGADNADGLRRANGVKYGEQPVPGRTYITPIQ